MKTNKKPHVKITHEGAPAKHITATQQLSRLVMSCFLFEKEFYVDGQSIVDQIVAAVDNATTKDAFDIAVLARTNGNLRHAPLMVAKAMADNPNHRHVLSDLLQKVIMRADELAEFLALYWKDGKKPIGAQVKKGLAKAFLKFNEYSLAKYNRDGAVKLRDVIKLCHVKPTNNEECILVKKTLGGYCENCGHHKMLHDNRELKIPRADKWAKAKVCKDFSELKLNTPDTWEVAISACGSDEEKKSAEWTRLIKENKLGALAFIRNLRNMEELNVKRELIKNSLSTLDVKKVLPFRFIAAAIHAPKYEPDLERLMLNSTLELPKLKGRTALYVDMSGSMRVMLSINSDMSRADAACGLAIVMREICDDIDVYAFANDVVVVPARRGFALGEAIKTATTGGTNLGRVINHANYCNYDRVVVITDEQSRSRIPQPKARLAYMINVASYKNGVGYGNWIHIDGFSESIIKFISEIER